ncbi:MAG: response regulator transcription factor [Eubacterium sp.]|nr:response regulator transcription factor [Eubacterium sp.]
MNIGICDDCLEECNHIRKYCMNLGYEKIFLFSSGEELLTSPNLSSLNLLFLDIEMNDISGIEVKERLSKINSSTFIVFCTTHAELMPDAFGRNVISFITKPFSSRSIEHCIKKASVLSKDFFKLQIDESIVIPCGDILYLNSQQKYTIFHTQDGNSYSSRKSLREWADILNELGFCPVSRSAIINLKYYNKSDNRKVILNGNISIPVSRRHVQSLKTQFENYMMNLV